MTFYSAYIYGANFIAKFRWESDFLRGFHGTPLPRALPFFFFFFSIEKAGFSPKIVCVLRSKNPVFQIWLINLVFRLARNPVFRETGFYDRESGFFDYLNIKPAIWQTQCSINRVTRFFDRKTRFLEIPGFWPIEKLYFSTKKPSFSTLWLKNRVFQFFGEEHRLTEKDREEQRMT